MGPAGARGVRVGGVGVSGLTVAAAAAMGAVAAWCRCRRAGVRHRLPVTRAIITTCPTAWQGVAAGAGAGAEEAGAVSASVIGGMATVAAVVDTVAKVAVAGLAVVEEVAVEVAGKLGLGAVRSGGLEI